MLIATSTYYVRKPPLHIPFGVGLNRWLVMFRKALRRAWGERVLGGTQGCRLRPRIKTVNPAQQGGSGLKHNGGCELSQ